MSSALYVDFQPATGGFEKRRFGHFRGLRGVLVSSILIQQVRIRTECRRKGLHEEGISVNDQLYPVGKDTVSTRTLVRKMEGGATQGTLMGGPPTVP